MKEDQVILLALVAVGVYLAAAEAWLYLIVLLFVVLLLLRFNPRRRMPGRG